MSDLTPIRTWEYRIVEREATVSWLPEPETTYEMIESYMDEDGSIVAWSEVGNPRGISPQDLRDSLERMIRACEKPPVKEEDLPHAVSTDGD